MSRDRGPGGMLGVKCGGMGVEGKKDKGEGGKGKRSALKFPRYVE